MREFVPVRLLEAYQEARVRRSFGRRSAGFHGTQRCALPQTDGDAVFRPEDLHAYIVAQRTMTPTRQYHQHAVGHLDEGSGGIEVVVRGEHLELSHASLGEYLLRLTARQPAQKVELVDVQIPEDAPGVRDVLLGRRLVVVPKHVHRVQRSKLPGLYEALCLPVAGIEASHKSDLKDYPGRLDPIYDRHRLLVIERD